MDPDSYQIEVLHYLNPHLMWVEVKNADTKKPVHIFEQVGIYGVLPQEISILHSGEGVTTDACKNWAPAAVLIMKKSFQDAAEIWFSPTFIDRRSSIFDDNIHKFGEITLVKRNGKIKSLTQRLVKSGFASFDSCFFHKELSSGNIKTKLNEEQRKDVILKLEKSEEEYGTAREQTINDKTEIYHTVQKLQSYLTSENLGKHNRQMPYGVMEKIKDLENCKDCDEVSIGRGSSRKGRFDSYSPCEDYSGNITEKIKDLKSKDCHKESIKWSNKSKKEIFVNNKYSPHEETIGYQANYSPLKNDGLTKGKVLSKCTLDILEATKKYLEDNAINKEENASFEDDFNDLNHFKGHDEIVKRPRKKGKSTNTKIRMPPKNENEKYTAYGPPDCNPGNLCFQVRPIVDGIVDDMPNVAPASEDLQADLVVEKIHDMYERVDSVVDLNLSGKVTDNLKNSLINTNELNVSDINSSEKDISTDHDKKYKLENPESKRPLSKFLQKRLQIHRKQTDNKITDFERQSDKVQSKQDLRDTELRSNAKVANASIDSTDSSSEVASSKFFQKKLELYKKLAKKTEKNEQFKPVSPKMSVRSKILQKKLLLHNKKVYNDDSSTSDIAKDSTSSDNKKSQDSDDESKVLDRINKEYTSVSPKKHTETPQDRIDNINIKNNVNPFKNVDGSMSVFVDKLVTPILMVHTKMNRRIQPCFDLREVGFNEHIKIVLKNMSVQTLMMVQSISWFTILRGYSLFMVSPLGSGKTMGYVPAVCRLVSDFKTDTVDSVGPTCIIVCATAKSVTDVEKLCRMFLGLDERVVTCFTGMDEVELTSSLLNGCDLLICTPSMLVRLLKMDDFGLDLRRLSTFVLDDCERLSEVYVNEVKYFLIEIKEMLKTRANKELKVQYIAVSRIWCNFMEALAKKAPNSVICIGAFQECVLYSKARTTVNFVKKENKVKTVLEFINQIDYSKKTVVVCGSDEEVLMLEDVLTKQKKIVFACNDTMTVHDLYNLNKTWADYQEPILGPILICCDGNLTHLNVTDAHYLIHFSLPSKFSRFCKRFSVLNDNYASIFKTQNEDVKIKVLLDDDNIEQLPKILNFIKRCTDSVPEYLDEVCSKVLAEKDAMKAKMYIPVCDNLLALGECPDYWNCVERHAIIKKYDEPKQMIPKKGIVTFKIIHYHTATLYSVRLLSNIVNGAVTEYPQTYSALSLKLGMYFSKECNQKSHGTPKVGDICAVSIKQNFFVRCQVMKILSEYAKGKPNEVIIKLIDEETLDISRDIYLYYLPEEFKKFETNVAQVRLANITPKDKDVTFSDLAMNELKKITDKQDYFMRGQIRLTVGNCVFVDTLEACQELTSLNETVVNEDFKKVLLKAHAISNTEHIEKLEKLCRDGKVTVEKVTVVPKVLKQQAKPTWAYLDPDGELDLVSLSYAANPSLFFVRHDKFATLRRQLFKDIQKYVTENPEPAVDVRVGDIVLAGSNDDHGYERARIDEITNDKAKCFFVDEGDSAEVPLNKIINIPDSFITKIAFQAIECRLIGLKPMINEWSEFSNNWFFDNCEVDDNGDNKRLYLKYFTKETAEYTNGHKYGVVLVDTGNGDVLINQFMIDANLAIENDEVKCLDEFKCYLEKQKAAVEASKIDDEEEDISINIKENKSKINNVKINETIAPEANVSKNLQNATKETALIKETVSKEDFETKAIALKPDNRIEQVDKYAFDTSDDGFDLQIDDVIWDMFNSARKTKFEKPTVQNTFDLKTKNDGSFDFKSKPLKKSQPVKITEIDSYKCVAKSCDLEKTKNISIELDSIKEKYIPLSLNVERTVNNEEKFSNKSDKVKEVDRLPFDNERLDSDDVSTECSQESMTAEVPVHRSKQIEEIETLDSDDISECAIPENYERKPTLIWRQTKTTVFVKVKLIGVESYNLEIRDRSLEFNTDFLDTPYGFNIELYGVVDVKNSSHTNKGQYIQVNLRKNINRTWLNLCKDAKLKKWIVYDLDHIDLSSDEEVVLKYPLGKATVHNSDSESDLDIIDDC